VASERSTNPNLPLPPTRPVFVPPSIVAENTGRFLRLIAVKGRCPLRGYIRWGQKRKAVRLPTNRNVDNHIADSAHVAYA